MTPAEALLWSRLRDPQLPRFRRQHALGRFILDFYCPAARLCIELDGGVHDQPDQHERDLARTEVLAAIGIRVLRFDNAAVLTTPDSVFRCIRDALSANLPSPRS